jgi:hypothetical protein
VIRQRFFGSMAALALVFGAACSNEPTGNTAGKSGAAGGGTAGSVGAAGVGAGEAGQGGAAGSGPGTAGGSPAGVAGSPGVAGASGVAGAQGAAGSSDAGTAPDAATTGTGGASSAGDTPAWRAINIQDSKPHNVRFTAKMADPDNAAAMDGNSHAGDDEIAEVNTSKPLKKKLCVVLTGIGTGPGQGIGDWAGGQGYHVFQVGYSNAIAMAADGDTNTATPGNTRMNQFDGGGRTPANANTKRFDSIEGRVIKGIQYLETADPGADWGWFLNQDGTMRWSDGCFIGYSYGATHLAVIARYVRLGLGVSVSGPQSEGHPDADWLKMPSATPVERMYAMWGTEDEPAMGANGYSSHYTVTTMLLGYIGDVLHTTVGGTPGTPPYMGTHRFSVDGQGHTEFCAGNPPLYCNYMFHLPPYDQ